MNDRSTTRWLLASLALNLFLAGAIAGGAWRWWSTQGPAPAAAQPPRSLRLAADELAPEQQRAYRLGLRDARRAAAAQIQAARDGREQVLRLLAAPTLDRAAVAAALARTREADAAVRTGYEASVIDFAATLSPQERRTFTIGLAQRTPLGPPAAASARP